MSNKTDKKVSSSLKPRNQSSVFGRLTNTDHSTNYKPTYFKGQRELLDLLPQSTAGLVKNGLPQATQDYQDMLHGYLGHVGSLTADNMVNPEIYDAVYGLQSSPLLAQYKTSMNDLENELAAKNLTGGSYDALARSLLDRNLGLSLSQAANNAVVSGLGATGDYLNWQNQGVNTAGSGMTSLGNMAAQYQGLSQNLQNQLMAPLSQYSQYQSVVNPLQMAQADYYKYQPTGFQNAMGAVGGAFNALVPGSGGAFIAAGNMGGNPYANSQYSYGGTGNSTLGTVGQFFGGSQGAGKAVGSFIP